MTSPNIFTLPAPLNVVAIVPPVKFKLPYSVTPSIFPLLDAESAFKLSALIYKLPFAATVALPDITPFIYIVPPVFTVVVPDISLFWVNVAFVNTLTALAIDAFETTVAPDAISVLPFVCTTGLFTSSVPPVNTKLPPQPPPGL